MGFKDTLHCGHSGLIDTVVGVASGFSGFICRDSEVAHLGQLNSSVSAVTTPCIGVPHCGQGVIIESKLRPLRGSTLALQTPAVSGWVQPTHPCSHRAVSRSAVPHAGPSPARTQSCPGLRPDYGAFHTPMLGKALSMFSPGSRYQ